MGGGDDRNDDDATIRRRRFLAATGTGLAAAVAGCTGDDGEAPSAIEPTSTRATTVVESEATFASATADETTTDTEESTETEEDEEPDVGSGDRWPTFQADDANSGYAPGSTGPDGDLAVQWEVPFENASRSNANGQPAIANDVVYTAYPAELESQERYNLLCFRAHDAQTGEELWQTVVDPFPDEPNYGVGLTAGLTYAAGRVYGITDASVLFALNAETGAVAWRRSWDAVDRYTNVSPIVQDGVVYVALGFPTTGNTDGGVRALDATTGDTIWTYVDAGGYKADGDPDDTTDENDNGHFQGMAMGEESLYLAGDTSGVYALDPATGAERWEQHELGAENLTYADGSVYCYAGEFVTSLTPTGAIDWQTKIGAIANNNLVQTGYALANGSLYVVTYGGEVVALDADSGAVTWRTTPDDDGLGDVRGSPVLVGDGDVVYVGTSVGATYALDANTGTERWHSEYANARGGYQTVANGAVYVQATIFTTSDYEQYEGGLVVLA